ncbi:MAG: hypothetical protein LBQ88_04290, partial [Treponema sp.]|nr:hypothetical protein [Treponema sp.]
EQRILEGFLKEHGSEVVNMLFTEWNWDDALAVRYEEGKEEGKEDRDKEIAFNALNALKEGIPIETIQKITGMDIETISSLASQ